MVVAGTIAVATIGNYNGDESKCSNGGRRVWREQVGTSRSFLVREGGSKLNRVLSKNTLTGEMCASPMLRHDKSYYL